MHSCLSIYFRGLLLKVMLCSNNQRSRERQAHELPSLIFECFRHKTCLLWFAAVLITLEYLMIEMIKSIKFFSLLKPVKIIHSSIGIKLLKKKNFRFYQVFSFFLFFRGKKANKYFCSDQYQCSLKRNHEPLQFFSKEINE